MASVALLFVGAVLLINGLVLLDRIEGKAAIPLNLLVGALLMMTALLQVLSVPPSSVDFRSAAFAAVGFTLFGFTYLTVGANSLFGGSGSALGWYCGWAAGISMVLASVNFAGSTDLPMAWLWASWSVLFIAFFLALTTGKKQLASAAGVLAILQSATTTSIPGLMMINGSWSTVSVTVIAVVQIAAVLVYIAVAGALTLRPRADAPSLPVLSRASATRMSPTSDRVSP